MSEVEAMLAGDLPEPDTARWRLMRAGLENIWEYDSQRFVFHRGHLMLRGRNESGKSKVLEVLLPFLLDGSLLPSRLDPFGSTSRQMRWNLINDGTPKDVQVSVGFVWLELGRRSRDGSVFCTLGARLRAKRSDTGLEVDYFISSLRPDRDFRTVDAGRRLLSRKGLEEALGERGRLFRRASDYRREVNRTLFGLPDEQYDALVETLLQLRRPQLSKQLQPSELSSILSASLPPLDQGVIGRLAEGFQRLDRDRAERDELARTRDAAAAFLEVYSRYVAGLARARACAMTAADSAYQRRRTELRQSVAALDEIGRQLQACQSKLSSLEDSLSELDARREALEASDEYRSVQRLDEAEREAGRSASRADEAASRARLDEIALERKEQEAERLAGELQAGEQKLRAAHRSAQEAAQQAALDAEAGPVLALAEEGDLEGAEASLGVVLQSRRAAVERLVGLGRQVDAARASNELASERFRDRQAEETRAREAVELLELEYERTVSGFREHALVWLRENLIQTDRAQEERISSEREPESIRGELVALAKRRRAELDAERADARLELDRTVEHARALEEERDVLEAASHIPPDLPAWRSERGAGRAGAPFYMLCDFQPGVSRADRAGVEAALEASGILDAWVSPEGFALEAGTREVLLEASPPAAGAGLDRVLVPTPLAGVSAASIAALIASIRLEPGLEGRENSGEAAVSACGAFRLGPLSGWNQKQRAEFIGAGARSEARTCRLDELARRIEQAGRALSSAESTSVAAEDSCKRLEAAIDEMPSTQAAERIADRIRDASALLDRSRAERDLARQALTEADQRLSGRLAERDAAAVEMGLSAWKEQPGELGMRSDSFRDLAASFISRAARVFERRARLDDLERDRDDIRARLESSSLEAEQARSELVRARTLARTLREKIGATRDQLLTDLAEVRTRRGEAQDELSRERERKDELNQKQGAARQAVLTAEGAVAGAEEERARASDSVRSFAARSLLAIADLSGLDTPPESWSLTDTLLESRRVVEATSDLDASPDARERRENKVSQALQQCQRELPPEIRLSAQRLAGVLEIGSSWNARPLGLSGLVKEIDHELAERSRLLDEEEMDLFESFLSGETHEHLQARLRMAHELVERMNAQLVRRPTASGMVLRLSWKPIPDAPAGTGEAIGLMLRAGSLLTTANRRSLAEFLRARLDEARYVVEHGSLADRMSDVLDYRGWFRFTIEFRKESGSWRLLTRKAHGAGSGGQKAVMLHMPLFAATAAFYESAREDAARLVALDEAFAGIDREMRSQLMGLLVHFDLDFVMTSHDEWGFYSELDGLSTYHLAREPGMRGVYTDRFLWDGSTSMGLGSA